MSRREGTTLTKQNQDVLRVAFSNPEKAMGNSINEKELEDGLE